MLYTTATATVVARMVRDAKYTRMAMAMRDVVVVSFPVWGGVGSFNRDR